MNKIAIIGSTGMLGQPATKELMQAGFEVTLLVRDLAKAKRLFGDSVDMIQGDIQNAGDLQQLMNGQDGLYLNLSVAQNSGPKDFQPEREGLNNILNAAKKAGIKRVSYLSSLVQRYQGQNGFHWWAFDIKQEAIAAIKNSGLPYAIFYPSMFMENFDKGAYRQGNKLAMAGTSRHQMYLIAGSDYGKQVAQDFRLNRDNKDYVVQGPDPFTADEAAEFYVANHTGKKVRIMRAPLGLMSFLGKFSRKFDYAAHIIEAINNYPEQFEAETTWKELGRPQTRFVDYVRRSE